MAAIQSSFAPALSAGNGRTRRQSEIELISRALSDESFKCKLMATPHAVIEAVVHTSIPTNVTIHVLEEPPDTHYVVLPRNPFLEVDTGGFAEWPGEIIANQVLERQITGFPAGSGWVVAKAWSDSQFRDQLRNDAALLMRLCDEMRPNTTVRLLEENAETIYIIIPQTSNQNPAVQQLLARELSELEAALGVPTFGGDIVMGEDTRFTFPLKCCFSVLTFSWCGC